MRAVGLAERVLELMCRRLNERTAFGKPLAQQGVMIERFATSRIQIDQVRLLVLHAAWKMDEVGKEESRREIAEIKGRRRQHGLRGRGSGDPGLRRRGRH